MPKTSSYLNALKPESESDLALLHEAAHDCFTYHPWTADQVASGERVREALMNAFVVVIQNCPPGPDRSVALRKIRESRMDANSAITHGGRY